MTPAISVENLSKRYRLGQNGGPGYRTLREAIRDRLAGHWARGAGSAVRASDPEEFWALREVTFAVQPGEVIGVIGRNGAGKSTLLKILSRITDPHAGRVVLRGRVSSLLEVGTGFHSELTGRENIFLNAAINGMTRREVARKFDSIVDFAEIEAFLDTPVKRYSSGMFVRLAFAVAAHLEPEILLVDEVLAVGDAAFQRKCLGKMGEVSRSGRTVLFVSHNMATILNLCDRVVVLERGRLAFDGECEEGIARYNADAIDSHAGSCSLEGHPNRRMNSRAILSHVRIVDASGRTVDQVASGDPIGIELEVDPRCPPAAYHFAIGFEDLFGCRLFTAATYLSDDVPESTRDRARIVCAIRELPLTPGRYYLTLNAGPREWVWTDVIDRAIALDVRPTDFYGNGRLPNPEWGPVLIRSSWTTPSR